MDQKTSLGTSPVWRACSSQSAGLLIVFTYANRQNRGIINYTLQATMANCSQPNDSRGLPATSRNHSLHIFPQWLYHGQYGGQLSRRTNIYKNWKCYMHMETCLFLLWHRIVTKCKLSQIDQGVGCTCGLFLLFLFFPRRRWCLFLCDCAEHVFSRHCCLRGWCWWRAVFEVLVGLLEVCQTGEECRKRVGVRVHVCEMHGDGAKRRLAPLKWSMCIWTCLNVCMCGCILKAAMLWPILPPPLSQFQSPRGFPAVSLVIKLG